MRWLGVVVGASLLLVGCEESQTNEAGSSGSASSGGGGNMGGAATAGPGGGGGAGGHAMGGGGAAPRPDACFEAKSTCPVAPSNPVAGSGLSAIDRCAFPLEEQGFASDGPAAALAEALPVRALGEVLADLNRAGTTVTSVPGNPANVSQAFGWNGGDQDVAYWVPQGLTGSADASSDGLVAGREVVLASWYYQSANDPDATGDKGVRVSLADVTNAASVAYRHMLLVEPFLDGDRADFRPVAIHAGGLAWIGDHLYVADTVHGFRVFDMSRVLQVETGSEVIGYDATAGSYYAANYKYVVPQIGNYERAGDCAPRFSFVALDRSTSPPNLLSGEYDANSLAGRLFHWPLANGDRLAGPLGFPSAAYFAMHSHIQGAVSSGATHWLSSSEPPAGAGDLYVAAESTMSTTVGWVDAPEDLMLDTERDKLWSLSEAEGERFVFAVSPPP